VSRVFLGFPYLGFGDLNSTRFVITLWYAFVLHHLHIYEVFHFDRFFVCAYFISILCYLHD
jgi:hypothetical protein